MKNDFEGMFLVKFWGSILYTNFCSRQEKNFDHDKKPPPNQAGRVTC